MSSGLPRVSLRLLRDRRGLSTVEYAIVLVLVVCLCIGVFQAFGKKLRCALAGANSELGRLTGEGPGASGLCPEAAGGGSGGPGAASGPVGPASPGGGATQPGRPKRALGGGG